MDPARDPGGELAAELPGGERFRFSAEDGIGLAVELEYRLRPRLGLEIAALTADLDAEFSIAPGGATLTDTEQAIFELYSAGVNYHLTPGRHLDLHVGAFAAITYFDDVIFLTEAGRSDKLVFDDDVGFGLKLGLDRPLGAAGRWQVSAGLRYLSAILEGEAAGQDADLDPLILTVGIGYRL